jgi:hypothetical protein
MILLAKERTSSTRATTRDRPYHGRTGRSSAFVAEGDPLWSPSGGCSLISTRAVIRQQSLTWVGFFETRREAGSSRRGGGRVGRGGDALWCASPSSWSCERLPRLPGRRKRPLPPHPPPPPLRVRSRFRCHIAKYLPLKTPLPPLRMERSVPKNLPV